MTSPSLNRQLHNKIAERWKPVRLSRVAKGTRSSDCSSNLFRAATFNAKFIFESMIRMKKKVVLPSFLFLFSTRHVYEKK